VRWSVTITSAPPPRLPPPNLRRRRDDPAAVTFTPCAARNARTSSMNGVKRPRGPAASCRIASGKTRPQDDVDFRFHGVRESSIETGIFCVRGRFGVTDNNGARLRLTASCTSR